MVVPSSSRIPSPRSDPDVDSPPGPDQPLLDNQQHPLNDTNMGTMTRLGMLRAYYLGAVCCIGGFLFGYDSGIIGGVLTLTSFGNDFGFSKGSETSVSSLAVALQQLGAFVACFAVWPVTHRYGRRLALVVCSTIFCIGALIQTINTQSRPAFYVGRVIAGVGLGGASVVVPMYSSEMSPAQLRGQIGYWVDYGVANNISGSSSSQWQIPVGLQLVPAGLLGLGMLTLKESTRWLTLKGRHDEAWQSLKWIRADESEETQVEMDEIYAAAEYETQIKQDFKLTELVDRHNLKRTATAAAVFTAQQATGATAFAYYGPQYFKLLVGSKGTTDLLLTAIFGAVKFLSCLLFVLFVADRFNRRNILAWGAFVMAACQIATAAVLKHYPPPKDAHVTSSGIATIALIYMFVMMYNFSWGPLPWPYVAEIFPARIREPGIGAGVACQWLFNFVFSLTTPYMIKNMGWGTFLLWGLFDLLIAAYSWFGLTETRGKTLEEITGNTNVNPRPGTGSSGTLLESADGVSSKSPTLIMR